MEITANEIISSRRKESLEVIHNVGDNILENFNDLHEIVVELLLLINNKINSMKI